MSLIDNRKYVNVLSRESESEMPVRGGVGGAVISVNGKTGVVELTAEDVGAATFMKAIEGELTVPYEKIVAPNSCGGQKLMTCVNLPNMKYGYLASTFDSSGLTEIKGFDKVTDGEFYQTFANCLNLSVLPNGMLSRFNGLGVNGETPTYTFRETFYNCKALKTVPADMFGGIGRNLKGRMFYQTFWQSGLETIPVGFMDGIIDDESTENYSNLFYETFRECRSLTTIPTGLWKNIKYIRYYSFYQTFMYCNSLETIPDTFFDYLEGWAENDTNRGGSGMYKMFSECSSLTGNIVFRKLTRLGYNMLYQMFARTKISSVSFPALTPDSFEYSDNSTFNGMLQGVTGCTVHFPANVQSVIGSWSAITGGFGGTNTTVLFDLPNVE